MTTTDEEGGNSMHHMHYHDSQRGVALVLTLGIVLVVGLLVLGSAVMGVIDRSAAANQYRSNAAYYLALTGVDVMKTAIFNHLVEAYDEDGGGWCDSPIVDSIGGDFLPGTWYEGKGDGGGTFRVAYSVFGSIVVVESEGEFGNATSRVRLVASSGPGPSSAWDNAITAQGRPTEKAIAGNTSVYGSVHIVKGDIEDIDGSLDTSGTAGIYSDYFGNGVANSDIRLRIDDLVDTEVDLCARVKIAQGDIYMAGDVELGIDGPPDSRRLYSLHLGDGLVCDGNRNSCANNPKVIADHNENSRIWLRNPAVGMSLDYEPFDIRLPRLNEHAFDPTRVFLISQPSPMDQDDPLAACAWLYDGDVARLPPADPSVSHLGCGAGGNRIEWLAEDGGYLSISGRVNITDVDDLFIHAPVNYAGIGAILVGDADAIENPVSDGPRVTVTQSSNIEVDAPIRPLADGTYLNVEGGSGDVLALLATRDITFRVTASDPPSAVLLYANSSFVSQRQATIVGAIVAEVFDMNQVPKIAWHPDVPEAANRLGLPGTANGEEGIFEGGGGGGVPQNPGVLANIAIERY